MIKKLLDNGVFQYSDDSGIVTLNFDTKTGFYQFLFTDPPLQDLLKALIPLSQFILDNPPIVEKTNNGIIDLNNINQSDLVNIINALASKLNVPNTTQTVNTPPDINTFSQPLNLTSEVKNVVSLSKVTQDVITNFEKLFPKNITFEEKAEARLTLQKYINNTEYDELLKIKEDLENDRFIVDPQYSIIVDTFLDIVVKYIGYIEATRNVAPNLKVDVWGKPILSGQFKTVNVDGIERQIPADFNGVKLEVIEPEFRRNANFESFIDRKIKW